MSAIACPTLPDKITMNDESEYYDGMLDLLERHGELLAEAGFTDTRLEDASDWYRREYEQISGPLKTRIVTMTGQADHLEEDWRSMVVVCHKGEMRQGNYRAMKPFT
jgi:hypothetical protein